MNVMYIVLAAAIAVGPVAAPAAGQDNVRSRQIDQRSKARAIVRAQQEQRREAQRAREQTQRAARQTAERTRQDAQRMREQAQRLAREQTQRQRAQQQREAQQKRQEQQRTMWRSWPEATETFSRTVRLGRSGSFDLQNVAGNIIVKGGGGDDVRIDAVKRVRHRMESEARAALPQLRIDVVERAGTVEVRTNPVRGRNVISFVEYTVAVPSGATVLLRTVSGDLQVSNISGELRAQSVSGNVTVAAVRRLRELRSASGTLDMSDTESDELTAHTLSGDVLARNLKGRVLDVQTVSGDVRLSGVEIDRARLSSTTGDLEYGGRLARNGRYEFQTHSGDISVSPTGNAGFTIQADTLSGDARSDITLKQPQDAVARPNESLRGTAGDGSATVAAQSFSGDILLLRR
jgi:DUF4097 and DUF4098 domain-containing protein YvlB